MRKLRAPNGSSNKRSGGRRQMRTGVPVALRAKNVAHSLRVLNGINTRSGNGVRIVGSEIANQSIYSGSSSPTGNLIFTTQLNPTIIGAPRLASLSTVFDRFYFNKLSFHMNFGLPTTASGTVFAYYDNDPTDDPTQIALSNRLAYLSSHKKASEYSVWTPNRWQCPIIPPNQVLETGMYYTNYDSTAVQFTSQGTFNIFNGALNNTALSGMLWVDYDITLLFPSDNEASSSGFTNYFVSAYTGTSGSVPRPNGSSSFTNNGGNNIRYSVNSSSTINTYSVIYPGTYFLQATYQGSSLASISFNASNVDLISTYNLSNQYGIGVTTANQNTAMLTVLGNPSSSSNGFTVVGSGTTTACYLRFISVNAGFQQLPRFQKQTYSAIDSYFRDHHLQDYLKPDKREEPSFTLQEFKEEKKYAPIYLNDSQLKELCSSDCKCERCRTDELNAITPPADYIKIEKQGFTVWEPPKLIPLMPIPKT
jgi:hypothetical protein